MKVPSKRACKKAVNTFLKRHGVKLVDHRAWLNRKKARYAKGLILEAGFDALESRFDDVTMYINYRNRPMILTPGPLWRGKNSERKRVETLATIVHEMAHHKQCAGEWINFYAKYFGNADVRADWETAAESAGADIYCAFGMGHEMTADDMFNDEWRHFYRLDARHVAMAVADYRRSMKTRARNLCWSAVGAELLSILRGER